MDIGQAWNTLTSNVQSGANNIVGGLSGAASGITGTVGNTYNQYLAPQVDKVIPSQFNPDAIGLNANKFSSDVGNSLNGNNVKQTSIVQQFSPLNMNAFTSGTDKSFPKQYTSERPIETQVQSPFLSTIPENRILQTPSFADDVSSRFKNLVQNNPIVNSAIGIQSNLQQSRDNAWLSQRNVNDINSGLNNPNINLNIEQQGRAKQVADFGISTASKVLPAGQLNPVSNQYESIIRNDVIPNLNRNGREILNFLPGSAITVPQYDKYSNILINGPSKENNKILSDQFNKESKLDVLFNKNILSNKNQLSELTNKQKSMNQIPISDYDKLSKTSGKLSIDIPGVVSRKKSNISKPSIVRKKVDIKMPKLDINFNNIKLSKKEKSNKISINVPDLKVNIPTMKALGFGKIKKNKK